MAGMHALFDAHTPMFSPRDRAAAWETSFCQVVKVMELENVSGSTSSHTLFQGLTMQLKKDDWKVVFRHIRVSLNGQH